MLHRLSSLRWVLHFRGLGYAGYFVCGFLWPRLGRWILFESRYAALFQRIFGRLRRPTSTSTPVLAPSERERPHREEDVVVGRIDNDGRLLAFQGPLSDLDEVDATDFVERYRFDLDIVRHGDFLALRKNYRGNRQAFLREWRSLAALGGQQGCPTVHRVDEENLVLYKSFIAGQTLRQHLARSGARILSVDTEGDPELAQLSAEERLEAVWSRGRDVFAKALPEGLLTLFEQRLDALHRQGVTGFSLSFGNVVLHRGEPWLIDFDAAVAHDDLGSLAFALSRDRDRQLFNRIYGRDLLTERNARALLNSISTPYSPVDLGNGLAHRGFWSVDSGTGRWETLNQHALGDLIQGKRILDLGAFHGLMPLLMLSAGARQVVALEKMPENVERGRHLRRLFEWRDMRSYDLDLRRADMLEILKHEDGLSQDWGTFDIATAFCSLYYLDEDDMASVVRRIAEIAEVLVLQAKTDTRSEAGSDKAKKSSLGFLRELLERHGFPRVEIIAPAGYTRPLLIGYREVDPPRPTPVRP